ncbi:hypothetical protein KUTeg_008161 [Tegillarca granosa]|uniref:Uncharacterized protein n=1 Tax=Tegillarca granosa TaxID=220873 RepID=A0ABQ9FBG0_TEGGR|nr:hypothetical protein KUTeg_008161 [Tegillarca granosa]
MVKIFAKQSLRHELNHVSDENLNTFDIIFSSLKHFFIFLIINVLCYANLKRYYIHDVFSCHKTCELPNLSHNEKNTKYKIFNLGYHGCIFNITVLNNAATSCKGR